MDGQCYLNAEDGTGLFLLLFKSFKSLFNL